MAFAVGSVAGLSACASWSALDNYPEVPNYCGSGSTKPSACTDMPEVAEQVGLAGSDAAAVTRAMKGQLVASQAVDIATFGLATALGVKLVHGGALTNSAKNLAYAAGASYVAGTLFFPRTTGQAQVSARSSLTCVAARGNDLLSAYSTQKAQIDAAWDQVTQLPKKCQTEDQFLAMVSAHDTAFSRLRSTRDSKISLAQLLYRARLAAHDGLQAQLDAERLAPEAYLVAGKSALNTAGSLASAGTPSTGNGSGTRQLVTSIQNAPEGECKANHLKTIAQLKTTFEGAYQTLAESVNAVAEAGKDCGTTPPVPSSTLTVSQKAVVLHAGEDGAVVVVSGGRPPLQASWIGALPKDTEARFTWLVANQQIRLFAPAGAAGGSSYTLHVWDSSASPAGIDISVTTTK